MNPSCSLGSQANMNASEITHASSVIAFVFDSDKIMLTVTL